MCTDTTNDYIQISQAFSTCPGISYNLSYYYRIAQGNATGSYLLTNITDTASGQVLMSEELGTYCDPGTGLDGYGNLEGSWYQATSDHFSLVTATSYSMTIIILLRSGLPGQPQLVVDLDQIVIQAIVPASITMSNGVYPSVTGSITGTMEPSSVPSVTRFAEATPLVTGVVEW